MYIDTPDVSYMPYEDDSAYWSFCSDFTDFPATDLKLEYSEPAFEKVEYPPTPEAISPGPIYEQHPIMIPSPTYSSNEPIGESHLHPHAPLAMHPQHHHHQEDMSHTGFSMVSSSAPRTPHVQHIPMMAPHRSIYPSPPMSSASSIHESQVLPQVQPLPPAHPQAQHLHQEVSPHHYLPGTPTPAPINNNYGFASSSGGAAEKGQITPEHLSMKIQNMGFHCSFPQVRSVSEKSLKLWMPLASLEESRRNIIMHKAMEKDLNPTVVLTHLQMFPDNDWAADCPQELRQYPVIAIEMGGSALDSKSKHVKRPLNSFMIYRKAQTQRARINAQRKGIKINHQTISSIVGLLWQTESSHVHEFFSEAAGVEKHLHSEQHPNYKFKPRKKAKVISKD